MIKYIVFHPWRAALILALGILVGTGAFYGYQVNAALGVVASEEFDPVGARAAIESGRAPVVGTSTTTTTVVFADPDFDPDAGLLDPLATDRETGLETEGFNRNAYGEPIPDEEFEAYLLVGTDASGFLADTIIFALQPADGSTPIMTSLPRDLYVPNICKGRFTRLNEGLGGCPGAASGSELMAIMVEDYTGIPVDHLARVDFDGFARLVDVMGGVTVCVDRPTRDHKSHLEILTPGCHLADGETALAWVRSRQPEELRDEEWVPVGGSDFTRQRRQQDVLFQLAGRAARFSSPAALTSRLQAVSSAVRLDSSWSFAEAVATAWRYRGIDRESVRRFSISVSNYRTSGGAAVLLPAETFREELESVYTLD